MSLSIYNIELELAPRRTYYDGFKIARYDEEEYRRVTMNYFYVKILKYTCRLSLLTLIIFGLGLYFSTRTC